MMKKLLLLFVSACAMPVFAVCMLNGTCLSNTSVQPQTQKSEVIDKSLKSNSLQRNFSNSTESFINIRENSNYNTNCQFGICLPGSNNSIQEKMRK